MRIFQQFSVKKSQTLPPSFISGSAIKQSSVAFTVTAFGFSTYDFSIFSSHTMNALTATNHSEAYNKGNFDRIF